MRISKNEKLIRALLSYINSQDIDEFICKKVKDCKVEQMGELNTDEYDCMDCIRKFFETPCIYYADNEVCVNADSEHCADFVGPEQCGKCYEKCISRSSCE